LGVALASITSASASEFLTLKAHGSLQQVTRDLIESTLQAGLSTDSQRLWDFEEELRPMYAALPKNGLGTLEPAAVRYALHRYFVQKHGWYIKGLEPSGQAWNTTSATGIMASRVPAYIQGLFEQRLHGQGMQLRDLAVFASTLVDFVHNQAIADMMDLYKVFNVTTTNAISEKEAAYLIKAYILQIVDLNSKIESMQTFLQIEQHMKEDFPGWDEFQLWVQDVRQTMSRERSRRSLQAEALTLNTVVEEVLEVNDRLGVFQDLECKTLKGALVDLEYKNSGRVLLSDFYNAGMTGPFLFNEHTDFLRRLGAIDESDKSHPSVIIANYLASQANCLASTSFHTVCCVDECEGLMAHLERAVAAPSAPPSRIAALVADLHSDTVSAPRNLSSSLVARLGEIAEHHHGMVPLHGRLFAQWMHHAYPLECPYPHATGTTNPLTPDEWMDAYGADEVALPEAERAQVLKLNRPTRVEDDELPWLAVEELVVTHIAPKRSRKPFAVARHLAAFAAIVAVAFPIVGLAMRFVSKQVPEKKVWI